MTANERKLLRAVVGALVASGTNERTDQLVQLLAKVDEESRPVPAAPPVETVEVDPGAISGLGTMPSAAVAAGVGVPAASPISTGAEALRAVGGGTEPAT